ncbi:MAG: hypothetical protein LBU34_06405 [Planctomycetaceae bacterium]|jgi:hypothetical protein|nr:hypothetical protein [Planctomycetaceae bacterium]
MVASAELYCVFQAGNRLPNGFPHPALWIKQHKNNLRPEKTILENTDNNNICFTHAYTNQ